jgi:hypothetical protein
MQTIPVYLYPNRVRAFSNALASSQTERYRNVYNRNIKAYRGADNRLELRIMNSDQKPRDITGLTIVFNMVSRDTQERVLKRDCTVQNISEGRVTFNLTEADLLDIEPGFYQYAITGEVRSAGDNYTVSSRVPLYVDSQYGVNAVIEVLPGVSGEPLDSTTVDAFRQVILYNSHPEIERQFYSSTINAKPETSVPQSLHSFQFYLQNYTGQVKIEGSLEEGGDPFFWTTIDTFDFVNQESFFHHVSGKWNYFRIFHSPTAGTVDKILYR